MSITPRVSTPLLLVLTVCQLCQSASSSNVAEASVDDCDLLLRQLTDVIGSNGSSASSSGGGDCCTTSWVACTRVDTDNRITSITTPPFPLNVFPSSWGSLTYLRTIDITETSVVDGTLPIEWETLVLLKYLRIVSCGASGTLPYQWRSLTNVTYLDLSTNYLTGILPPEWSALPSLRTLNVGNNFLSGTLPLEWGDLVDLTNLNAGLNSIGGILPPQWGNLTALKHLDLAANMLTGPLAEEWSGMRSIETLYLYSNKIEGSIPPSWDNMRNLMYVNISWNRLNGSLPVGFGAYILRELRLTLNDVSGSLPYQWGISMKAIATLHIAYNAIEGTLPTSWGDLVSLEELDLTHNRLGGTLPSGWSGMIQARLLRLSENSISGSLPEAWSRLRSLQALHADLNALAGTLPANWSAMESIEVLQLKQNTIQGLLPPEWNAMTQLRTIDLSSNRMNGSLPRQWESLAQLASMDISRNHLTGTLPPQWHRLMQLRSMSCHHNELAGSLPPEWGNFTKLEMLDASNNRLTGSLPPEWGRVSELNVVMLTDNDFEGPLPSEWAAVKGLMVFLSFNLRISGTLPLAFLANLTWFECIACGLSGPLPRFTNWSGRTDILPNTLVLYATGISGPIPEEYKYANIRALILQGTKVNGTIPHSFDYLNILDVSGTEVSGAVDISSLSLQQLFLDDTLITAIDDNTSFLPLLQKLSFSRCQLLQRFPMNVSNSMPMLDSLSAQSLAVAVSLASLPAAVEICDFANNTFLTLTSADVDTERLSNVKYISLLPSCSGGVGCAAPLIPSSVDGLTAMNAHEALKRDMYCTCCQQDATLLVNPMRPTISNMDDIFIGVIGPRSFNDGEFLNFLTVNVVGDLSVTLIARNAVSEIPANVAIPNPEWNGSVTPIPPLPSYRYQWTGLRDATLLRGVAYQLIFQLTLYGVPDIRFCTDSRVAYNVTRELTVAPCSAGAAFAAVPYSTRCVLCPDAAVCDGSIAIQTDGTSWRPSANVLPFSLCSEEANGCATKGDGTLCKEGYQGVLCAVCSEGFGKSGEACVACGPMENSAVMVALACGAALMAATYISVESTRPEEDKQSENNLPHIITALLPQFLKILLTAVTRALSKGVPVIKAILNLASIATTLTFASDAVYLSAPAMYALDTQQQIVAPALGNSPLVSCALPEMTLRDVLIGLLVAVPLLILVECVVTRVWHGRTCALGVVTCLLQLTYEYVVQVAVSLLQSDALVFFPARDFLLKQETDAMIEITTVVSDRRLLSDGWHRPVAWVVLVMFGLGAPLAITMTLRYLREKKGALWVQCRFRFLLEDYRDECWYWETVVMVRKLLSVVLVVPLWRYSSAQLQCIIVLMTLYSILHAWRHPNTSHYFFYAEQVASFATIIAANAMLFAASVSSAALGSVGVTSVIVVTQVCSLIGCLYAAWRELTHDATIRCVHPLLTLPTSVPVLMSAPPNDGAMTLPQIMI